MTDIKQIAERHERDEWWVSEQKSRPQSGDLQLHADRGVLLERYKSLLEKLEGLTKHRVVSNTELRAIIEQEKCDE